MTTGLTENLTHSLRPDSDGAQASAGWLSQDTLVGTWPQRLAHWPVRMLGYTIGVTTQELAISAMVNCLESYLPSTAQEITPLFDESHTL